MCVVDTAAYALFIKFLVQKIGTSCGGQGSISFGKGSTHAQCCAASFKSLHFYVRLLKMVVRFSSQVIVRLFQVRILDRILDSRDYVFEGLW